MGEPKRGILGVFEPLLLLVVIEFLRPVRHMQSSPHPQPTDPVCEQVETARVLYDEGIARAITAGNNGTDGPAMHDGILL